VNRSNESARFFQNAFKEEAVMNRIAFSYCLAMSFALSINALSNADTVSIGPDGINAIGLTLPSPNGGVLTGSGINIGQVEPLRPGQPDFDVLHNDLVDPDFVYYRDGVMANDPNIQNDGVGDHGQIVAGVMIAEHSLEEDEDDVHGVAPGAILHASAFDPTGANYIATGTATVLRTTQRIATVNGNGSIGNNPADDVRAQLI
jgi:hypothetical protein